MKPAAPGLYSGVVTHVRHRPKRHRLRYRIFMMLIDIDQLANTSRQSRLFSHNRLNWLSFYDKDHHRGSGLRNWIEGHMLKAGLSPDGGPVQLLCMPRVLGFVFNPLSIWFCWRKDGTLAAILYEVRNTFGQKHGYLIPAPVPNSAVVQQDCDKGFFVSPFMDMDLHYHFRVLPPAAATVLDIRVSQDGQPMLDARFAAQRQELTNSHLARALISHPLMTLMVVAGIHWEALKIFAKGIGLRPRAPLPVDEVSYIKALPS